MIRKTSLILGALLVFGCNHAASESSLAPVSAASAAGIPPVAATPSASSGAASSSGAPDPAGSLLAVGADVPDVSAVAQDGKTVKLRELKGKPLVVYFYPKDDTTGCTIEAKGIRDQYAELSKSAVVLGVSTDTSESHKAFADKYNLPFELLDDSSHALVTAFGVPVSNGHAKRVTFVFDAAGKVRKVFPNVIPEGHAAELLDALKSLG
jgi:peroxiredoxin Q/BCP